jgi:ATP-dependent DNA helicase RecG
MPESEHTEYKPSWREEVWVRGIKQIFEACRDGGAPEPKVSLSGNDLWTEFPFSPKYLEVIEKGLDKTTPKTTPKSTQDKILEILRQNLSCERSEIAETLGITIDGVKYHLNRLRDAGNIQHMGPSRGGHWRVLK